MARFKDANWVITTAEGHPNSASSIAEAALAVLMDLRDELKVMNGVMALLRARLSCIETLAIPGLLRQIAANTKRKKRAPRRKAVA